jgi:hypothetical protein
MGCFFLKYNWMIQLIQLDNDIEHTVKLSWQKGIFYQADKGVSVRIDLYYMRIPATFRLNLYQLQVSSNPIYVAITQY